LLKEHPDVAWMGEPALARFGLVEAKKAGPGVRFLIDPGQPADDPDDDLRSVWKFG
jgi:hypothetical protein